MFFLLLLFTLVLGEPRQEFINSPTELRNHFVAHSLRVKRLGVEVYKISQEWMKKVSLDLLVEFLTLHDEAKVNSTDGFRKKYWKSEYGKRTFAERLYDAYDKDWNTNAEYGRTRDQLNAADKKLRMEFFRERGLLDKNGEPNEIAWILLEIERIADVVDRACDPVAKEEFHRQREYLLSEFLAGPGSLRKAKAVFEKYRSIVAGLEWPNYSKSCEFKARLLALGL